MDYDTYEPYEDDLTELGNNEAWEDAQAEMESDYEYEDGWRESDERDEW